MLTVKFRFKFSENKRLIAKKILQNIWKFEQNNLYAFVSISIRRF